MHDTFEFREDFRRSEVSAECRVMLCPVKWEAAKVAMAALRMLIDPNFPETTAMVAAIRTVRVLDQVGLTPDFEPSKVS